MRAELGAGLDSRTVPEGTDALATETASVFLPPGPHGDGTPVFLMPGQAEDSIAVALGVAKPLQDDDPTPLAPSESVGRRRE